MQSILVVNPKGGSGKSTLAMNLAGFYACWGIRVAIADLDEQGSCREWLAQRPQWCPPVELLDRRYPTAAQRRRYEYLILDVPSAHSGAEMEQWLELADKCIVPVLPSPNDIRATRHFLRQLDTSSARGATPIGLVANRVRQHTRAYQLLKSFFTDTPYPSVAILRDAQNYVLAAQLGLTLFELPHHKAGRDLAQWQHLVKWLCVDPFMRPFVPIRPGHSDYEALGLEGATP